MDTKNCTKCGESKNPSGFYRDSRAKDQLRTVCKVCEKERQKAHYLENRDSLLESQAKRRKHPDNANRIREKDAEYKRELRKDPDACKKIREIDAKYRRGNKRKIRGRNLKRCYGITLACYEKMWSEQGEKCAICGRSRKFGERNFPVDHCHKTGKVRAILCSGCNTGIGHLRDDPRIAQAAVDYLLNHREKVEI